MKKAAVLQTTLKSTVVFEGIGLHSGKPVCVTLHPVHTATGIVFRRADLACDDIPALWQNVEQTALNTRLIGQDGGCVGTIEHLMAALAGTGVHNVLVEIDGPEVPIMDGSAAEFVRAIVAVGVVQISAPLYAIEILHDVSVHHGDAMASLSPATSLQIDFAIAFDDVAIGQQHKTLNMANGSFVRELCDSRTFCRHSDVAMMHENGLALGGSLQNAVVVDGADVLTPGGLRHADEAVRHKMLDALGDLYCAGAPILGRYSGHKAGHSLTNKLLRALFAQPDAWRYVRCDNKIAARLPGVGVTAADLVAVA